ncbi:hypothetical protein [Streptomyces xylophagus]|uniref:hypothetical protein n=1 Tax=Streptomyces xylophagus TaxID=285514 RepID=UPI0005B7F962|nr:hypothetical protein [Streptomyces xylophagus]
MTNDLLARLADLDAAPRRTPTAQEIDREETLLRSILDDSERPGRSLGAALRRPLVRRLSFTAAGALAAGLALVAVNGGLPGLGGSGPLSSSELASWTGTPKNVDVAAARASAAGKWCLDATDVNGTGTEPVISNADLRGKVASMIVTRGDQSAYCLAGSDGGTSMGISAVREQPDGHIKVDTLGARGSGDQELNYVVGWAGSDVRGITVRDHGHTTEAMIQGGRFTAWWPHGNPDGLLTGTLTLHLADGSTRTVEGDSLLD